MGICVPAKSGAPDCPEGDGKRYFADLEKCKVIKFRCAEGEEYFSDDCGCGCMATVVH